MKRLIVWFSVAAFVITQTSALADPHDEGVAAGQAANPVIKSGINTSNSSSVVPNYTTTPPQSSLYGAPNLTGQATGLLAACAAASNDPVCQALRGATISANTPRPPVGPYDPSVAAAKDIAKNPALVLGDLSSYYAGCSTSVVNVPPGTQPKLCQRYVGVGNFTCSKSLSVAITRTTNCSDGQWFASTTLGGTELDAQCLASRTASNQHFRITQDGAPEAFFDVDMTGTITFPQMVASLYTTYAPDFSLVTMGAWVTSSSCVGPSCSLQVMIAPDKVVSCTSTCGDCGGPTCTTSPPFLNVYAACPTGTQSGDNIVDTVCAGDNGCTSTSLDSTKCYAPSPSVTSLTGLDITNTIPGYYWMLNGDRPVVGWQVNPAAGSFPTLTLNYTMPVQTVTQTDTWDDQCPALATSGRCSIVDGPKCVDGPSTKTVDGIAVSRSCWQYETTMSCDGGTPQDQCAPLAAAGCTFVSSACQQTDPITGACQVYQDQYTCPTPGQTVTSASNCPSNVFCVQGSCFNIGYGPDGDFARASSMMEAAREAGVYFDSDRLQVFTGEADTCRDKLLTNCCYSDSAGKSMSNGSVFGFGSKLVFDTLMNSENRDFVYYGLKALLMDGGFSGTFSSYGFTIAVDGSALPSGTTVLYSSTDMAGEGVVIGFDPWSLAITAAIYVVMSMMSCSTDEAKTALKTGAGLCHDIGTWCSSCIKILGVCVACIEHTTSKCCFNSMLARIIQEQGRVQIGKVWGDPQSPDCSGFTIAQLQSLNFAAMDFTEFYASLVPKMPDVGALQGTNATRVPTCYFGQGKC